MSAAAGTPYDDACITAFNGLKTKRTLRFVTFKIDTSKVVLDVEGAAGKTYDDFIATLPENDCRYGVYDHEWTDGEGCMKSKIVFIAWSPDTAKVRTKMLYAASKDSFKNALQGVQVEMQACDFSEVDISNLESKIH